MASKIPGYAVHLFTASGALCGFFALMAADQGKFQHAFFWMIVALIIDTLDGTLARKIAIRERIPEINGHYLDLVVDFVNFVFVPAVVFFKMNLVPEPYSYGCVALILISGCYNFALENDTSDDGFFLGFPAAWHAVVFYLYMFQFPQGVNGGIVITLFLLHFVPIKFIYLTKHIPWPFLTIPMALGGLAASCSALYLGPPLPFWNLIALAIVPLYITGLSILAAKN